MPLSCMPQSRRTVPLLAIAGLAIAATAGSLVRVQAAQARPDRLKTVLAQMDAASRTFHSAQADVRKEHLEKIVNDTTTESGSIYFLRTGSSVQVGLRLQAGKPDDKTMEYKDGAIRLYTAATNHIDSASAGGNNQAKADTFVTLGFGGSGADLAKAWEIADQGTEQISDGSKAVSVEKLDLVSKDPGVRSNYSHVTIWIDPIRDVSLKLESFAPSGDTDTAIYSNTRLNQPIDMKPFTIKCRGKCS